MSNKTELRSTNEIPDPYAEIFREYSFFNGVQSTVFEDVVNKDDSLVVAAPTGSGKTVIFELAIVKLLMHTSRDSNFKIIYMAPVKALCSERFLDWKSKFTPSGLRCSLVTGDTDVDGDVTDLTNLQNMDMVVTTPEKWDFLTRRWRDHQQLMNSVRLFLIDEVHLLNDKSRGHVLEAVVSRMKMIQHQQQATGRLRFIAVSATVDNTQDLAAWLGSISEPAISYGFGEEMRPVALKKVVKGYDLQASGFRFDLNLSYKIEPLLKEHSEGKPALIFCSTRKGVLQTAQILSQMATFKFSVEQQWHINAACEHIVEGKLRDLVRRGIGYHHAGMPQEDRIAVENVFRNGHLPVLIATSTLAMGVNLPAHLVILKNTQFYNQGRYEEYSDNQILQMIGRAGRPQFDSSATAVIMTRPACVERFKRLVSGCDPVRSWLQSQIVEHLNAEIVLGSVRNLDDAVEWLKSTFYWVCAVRKPKMYGLPTNLTPGEIEIKLQEMILKELSQLDSYKLVKLVDNFETKQTPYGRIMARHYVSFDTMKLFLGMSGRETLVQLLDLLTRCAELRDVTLRMHEKRPLNDLNGNNFNGLRFPLPGKIVNKHMKINCLIQAVLGCRNLPEYSLVQDSHRVIRLCQRLSRCLYEVTAEKGFMSTQRSAAILAKCLRCQMWEDSPFVARQLPKIGVALGGLLVAAGKTTLDSLVTANPRDLERILNRFPPIGDEVRNSAASIARLQVQIIRAGNDILEVRVTRRILPHFAVGDDHHHWLVLIVGGSDDKLLFQKKFAASDVGYPIEGDETSASNAALSFNIYLKEPLPAKVHAFLISEMWVGVDNSTTLYLKEDSEDDGDMFCDVPVRSQDMFYTFTTAQPSKETPTQFSTKTAKKTPALKKTPAPKNTPAPKKTPAAPPQKPPVQVTMSSSDIRRFFSSVKQPQNAIRTNIAEYTFEEDELPESWRPSGSVFEKLRKDEDASQTSTEQRTYSASRAVTNIDRFAETSTLDEPVETAVSSLTTCSEFKSFMDEGEDRIIDCGFDAFMAEAIKEAEAEKNDENRHDEDVFVELPTQSEIARPEPRRFGSDLTNMTLMSNRPVQTVNDKSESNRCVDRYDKSDLIVIDDDAPSFTEESNLDEVPKSYLGTFSLKCGTLGDSTGDHGGSSWTERSKFETVSTHPHEEMRIHDEESGDSIVTIDLRHSPLIDRAKSDFLPKNSYKSEKINENNSDFSSTTQHRESPRTDLNRAATVPKNMYEEPNQEYGDVASKTSYLESPRMDRTRIDSIPRNSQEHGNVDQEYNDSAFTVPKHSKEKPNQEYGDFASKTSYLESTWMDRTRIDSIPRNSQEHGNVDQEYNDSAFTVPKHSKEKPNQEYGDFASKTSYLESPWMDRTRIDSIPRNSQEHGNVDQEYNDSAFTVPKHSNEKPNQEYGGFASKTSYLESPWMDRTRIDSIPRNLREHGNVDQEYNDFTTTIRHGESRRIDRTQYDAVSKNSHEYENGSEGFSDFASKTIYLDSPWMSRTQNEAVSKNSNAFETINEDYSGFNLTVGQSAWANRSKVNTIPKNSYEYKKPPIIPSEDYSNFSSTVGHKESPWMDRRNLDGVSGSITEYNKPTKITNEELNGNLPSFLHMERIRMGRTMAHGIPKNWYDDEEAGEEHRVLTSTIGHTQRPWMVGTKIEASPKNLNVSKRATLVYEEHCKDFPPAIDQSEIFWRNSKKVDAITAKKHVTNFIPEVESRYSDSSICRESTFFRKPDADAGLKSFGNKPIITTVQDDAELNLTMGRGQYSGNHTPPDRLQYDTAQKVPTRGIPKKWEMHSSTAGHVIFPTIDAKLETYMNVREGNSWCGLYDKGSDCMVNTDNNSDWDEQYVWRGSFEDPHDVRGEEILPMSCGMMKGALLPTVETQFGYDKPPLRDPRRRVPVSRHFPQSSHSASALSENYGSSIDSGNRTSHNSIAEIHGRKKDTLVQGIIAELGLPSLPYITESAELRGRTETSTRHRAVQAFDDFILRGTSAGQVHSSQTRNIPTSPEDLYHAGMNPSHSSLLRTPIRREHESTVPCYSPQLSSPVPWATPSLGQLKERSTQSYKLPHVDHVSSSFENIIASAKAEPTTKKRQEMFGSKKTDKRMRLAGKTTIAASTTQLNSEHMLISQCLQNSNIPLSNGNTAKSILPHSDTTSLLKRETLNFKPKSNNEEEREGMSHAPPQLPKTDKIISGTGSSPSVTPEKSEQVFNQIIDSAHAPNELENYPVVAFAPDQQPGTLRQSKVPQTSLIQHFSLSPKISSTNGNADKPSIMFPPSVFPRETVPKATSQQVPVPRPPVFKSRPVRNIFVTNINKDPQVFTTSTNGDRTPRVRFKPPPPKSQSGATNQ